MLSILIFRISADDSNSTILPDWLASPEAPALFYNEEGSPLLRVTPDSVLTTIAGFSGIARGITVFGDTVVIQEFVLSPPEEGQWVTDKLAHTKMRPEMVFKNVRVGPNGLEEITESDCWELISYDPFDNKLIEGSVYLYYQGWFLTFKKAYLSENGLEIEGMSIDNLEKWHSFLSVEDIIFKGSPLIVNGTIKKAIFTRGWKLSEPVKMKEVDTKGNFLDNPLELRYSEEYGLTVYKTETSPGDRPIVRSFEFTAEGNIIGGTLSEDSISAGTEQGFMLTLHNPAVIDGYKGGGILRLPKYLGATEVAVPKSAGWIMSVEYNAFIVSAIEDPISFHYDGWDFVLKKSSVSIYNYNTPFLKAEEAFVSYRDTLLPIGPLTIYDDSVYFEYWIGDKCILPFLGNNLEARKIVLENGILHVDAWLSLPAPFSGYNNLIEDIQLDSSGNYTLSNWYNILGKIGIAKIILEDCYIDNDIFESSNVSIIWQGKDLEVKLYAEMIKIYPDGSYKIITSSSGSLGSYNIRGCTFSIDNGDIIIHKGYFYLPKSLPGSLAGRRLSIKEIFLPSSTEHPPTLTTTKVDTYITMEYKEGEILASKVLSAILEDGQITAVLDQCSLPGISTAGTPTLDGIRISSADTIDTKHAYVSEPVTLSWNDCSLTLDSLVSADTQLISYTGTGKSGDTALSKGVPSSFTVKTFSIDSKNGKVIQALGQGADGTNYDLLMLLNK